jgi:hypothetical protein
MFCEQIQRPVQGCKASDFLLARNVVIQAGFLQVDRPGNILHRGSVKAFLSEDLSSSVQDLVSGHHASLPNGR